MVTLKGAHDAQPYATEINKLQSAFDALNAAANDNTSAIWKLDIQVYIKGISTTISLLDDFSNPDTAAILFDIRNIIGNKINVQTNALGAIV